MQRENSDPSERDVWTKHCLQYLNLDSNIIYADTPLTTKLTHLIHAICDQGQFVNNKGIQCLKYPEEEYEYLFFFYEPSSTSNASKGEILLEHVPDIAMYILQQIAN